MATRTGKPSWRFPWGRVLSWGLGVPVVLVIGLAFGAAILRANPYWFVGLAERLAVRTPSVKLEGDAEFFKYGAIGNEAAEGLPFKIWAVLPKVCPGLLPKGRADGYKAFGFTYEKDSNGADKELPIGLSRTRLGPGLQALDTEVLAINCATCHVQTWKLPGEAEPRIFVGGSNNRLDAQAYTRFLSACAEAQDFKTETVLDEMQKRFPETPWYERLMFRHLVIPVTRELIRAELGERFHWTWSRPAWGPGRLSPFNPVKFRYLEQPVDDTIDHSEVMPAWNVDEKEAMRSPTPWHWDGLSWDLREVVVNSALGDGVTRFGYSDKTIDRLVGYLRTLKSPKAPLAVDEALKARGETLFRAECASCHARGGAQVMTIIPRTVIGTDPGRIGMWTPESAAAYNNHDKGGQPPTGTGLVRNGEALLDWVAKRPTGLPWVFEQFQKHDGYLAQPLDGIWLTGPYLHNGSVPTLDDLLKPPAERPRAFVRGTDEIDLVRGGYVSPACEPGRYQQAGFCYDTQLRGNGNGGHAYGGRLTADERRALVHYLLTL